MGMVQAPKSVRRQMLLGRSVRRRVKVGHRPDQQSTPQCTVSGNAADAQRAGKIVLRFLTHLSTTGLYPPVISVSKTTVDAYGRRLIEAVDDSGEKHTIFTADGLDPGHLYFMHPTTNPMRVNPILVRLS